MTGESGDASAKENNKTGLVEAYLDQIETKKSPGQPIFRGQSNVSWKLESAAERRIRRSRDLLNQEAVDEGNILFYNEELVQNARSLGFGERNGRHLYDLEILAEIQHLGAATMLVDFSEDPLVALYFASMESADEDGVVYIVKGNVLDPLADKMTVREALSTGNTTHKWSPTLGGQAERRILRQKGVFVIGITSSENVLPKVTIKGDYKAMYLEELRHRYKIDSNSLFVDLPGFAESNSHNRLILDIEMEFFRGVSLMDDNRFEEASKHFKKFLSHKPSSLEALKNLALAYNNMGNHSDEVDILRKYVMFVSSDIHQLIRLATGLTKIREFTEALTYWDKAEKIAKMNAYTKSYTRIADGIKACQLAIKNSNNN